LKFMEQTLFEVCALHIAATRYMPCKQCNPDEEARKSKNSLYDGYHDSFKGDNLWYSQLDQAVEKACEIAKRIAPGKEYRLLRLAEETRKQLDDNLTKQSGMLWKAGLRGTFFTRSHPAPSSRPEIAGRNFTALLIKLNALDYMNMPDI